MGLHGRARKDTLSTSRGRLYVFILNKCNIVVELDLFYSIVTKKNGWWSFDVLIFKKQNEWLGLTCLFDADIFYYDDFWGGDTISGDNSPWT